MQAEAAAKYGEELRTESQQASSFIYHLKRFNNWVKATVRVWIGAWLIDRRTHSCSRRITHEVYISLCCHHLTIIRTFRHVMDPSSAVTAYFKS